MITVDVKQQCNNNNNSIVGNHALPVVRRVDQQLEHALCVLYRKSCFACHYEGEIIAGGRSLCYWKPLFACWYEGKTTAGAWSLSVLWVTIQLQQLELVFVSSMGSYISPVVMRAEQMLEHCLCSWKSCLASPYYS